MTETLLHPAYFGSIAQFSAMAQADKVLFENEDNYQKQTYRNRQYISGANGKLLLNIPVKHSHKSGHQKYKDVKMDNSFHWRINHWKSLQTAYRTSPFFEFYEDDFAPLYEKPTAFLMDFNYQCMEKVWETLELEIEYKKTEEYILKPENVFDLRYLINAKRENPKGQNPYPQVFQDKHGFLENLSVLDLLFNEGPNALKYLEENKFTL